MPDGPGVTPAEFAAALRKLDEPKAWTNELRRGYRKVGTKTASWTRAEMRSGSRGGGARLARAAGAVRGGATATAATVSVGGKSVPGAVAAVWGTKREHTGWAAGWYRGEINPNRAAGFAGTRRNTLPWVGANWQPGVAGSGPRGLNDAIAKHEPEIVTEFEDAMWRTMSRAFPGGFR